MNQYKYILQPYGNGRNTRFTCPNCGKNRQFTRYIDTETGNYVHETVGVCNRQSKCGYHYTPKQLLADNPWLQDITHATSTHQQHRSSSTASNLQQQKTRLGNGRQHKSNLLATLGNTAEMPISYISIEKLQESRRCYKQNNFVLFLKNGFGIDTTEKLISLYHIGTSSKWPGATVFWQIDQHGKIRTGKIMLYNKETGKRVKKPFAHLSWVHKVLKIEEFNLRQCFFGEHLLRQFPHMPVAVVESEKTAIISSISLPNYIWLATGSKGNLSRERCLALKGRDVTLFPDLGGFEDWNSKVKDMPDVANFTVSNLLELIANEEQKHEGLDLADFLLKRLLI